MFNPTPITKSAVASLQKSLYTPVCLCEAYACQNAHAHVHARARARTHTRTRTHTHTHTHTHFWYTQVHLCEAQVGQCTDFFDVLLSVHLSIFILVINQLDAQNLFYSKFISRLYMFRAPRAHRQEVKIVLYSLWYHHTYRYDDTRVCTIQF